MAIWIMTTFDKWGDFEHSYHEDSEKGVSEIKQELETMISDSMFSENIAEEIYKKFSKDCDYREIYGFHTRTISNEFINIEFVEYIVFQKDVR